MDAEHSGAEEQPEGVRGRTPTVRVDRSLTTKGRLEALAEGALQGALVRGDEVTMGEQVVRSSLRHKLFGRAAEPTRIGRFVIVRRIGAGGMGVVYSAFDEELDRKVAIKVLHAERSGSQGRARILREAQAVARISHPNIVHVYEVGELDTGQVFMAMQFVEGVTLDEWVHSHERSWREVLAVYRQAAQGLAAAHEARLTHRDVKPENILINPHGRVILLDFGLARVGTEAEDHPTVEPLDDGSITGGGRRSRVNVDSMTPALAETIARTLTESGLIMGTPAYMSPEQCSGLPADARSDQFSFCVSLYEGLYGERPFAGENLSKLILSVCQGEVREPPKGSKVPTWLRRVLLRGLSVRPAERWPTMQALATELARDPGRQRRRWLVASAAAISLAMGVLGMVQPWASGGICQAADERLAGVWDGARKHDVREALLSTGFAYADNRWTLLERQLDDYTVSWAAMYTGACEAHHRGEISAELYDRQMDCLESRLTGVSSLVEVLSSADSMVLQKSSDLLVGLAPLGLCGDTDSLRESFAPPPDQKTADAVRALRQQLIDIHLRTESGHALEVIEAAEGVVEAAKTLGYKPLLAEAHYRLGAVYLYLYRSKEAEGPILDAFLTADSVRHDRIAAEAGAWLVFLNAVEGRETEARLRAEHVRSAIARYGRTSVADVNLNRGLAALHVTGGRYDEARSGLQHALTIAESLPERQGESLATIIHLNIGQVCELQGDLSCMSASYERALKQISTRLGPEDPKLAMYQSMLANARTKQGRYDEAASLLDESLRITRNAFGEGHMLCSESLARTSAGMISLAQLTAARDRLDEALDVARDVSGLSEDSSEVLKLRATEAEILNLQGQNERALSRLDEVMTGGKETLEGSYLGKLLVAKRGQILLDLGHFEGAKVEFERSLVATKDELRFGSDFLRAQVFIGLARAHIGLAEHKEAVSRLVEVEHMLAPLAKSHWLRVDVAAVRTELALAKGLTQEARVAAVEVLRLLPRAGYPRIKIPRVRFTAAKALFASDPERALDLARQALEEEQSFDGTPESRRRMLTEWIAENEIS